MNHSSAPHLSKRFFVSVIVSFLGFATTSADQWTQAIEESTIAIQSMLDETKLPGISISIGHQGKIVWSRGFGYADIESKTAVDPAFSKFRIGSVSKPITAYAIGLLQQERKLDLDATIQTYVPSFPQKEWPITVRQTAGHLAGIRHYKGFEIFNQRHFTNVTEGLEMFQDSPLLHEPGSVYQYSSYGWNLLSAVIETSAEDDFLNFMDTRVFKPLGMEQTMADDLTKEIDGRVTFYNMIRGEPVPAPPVDNSYKWAGGGFLSTTDDLIRFAFAHLDPPDLEPETIELLWESMTTTDGKRTNYGIGWFTRRDKNGLLSVGHNGGSVGGVTAFRIYPERDLAIAIVINATKAKAKGLPQKIVRNFLQASTNE